MKRWDQCWGPLLISLGLALAVFGGGDAEGSSITQSFTSIAPGTTINTFVTPYDQWFMPVFHPELPYFRGVGQGWAGAAVVTGGGPLSFQFSGFATSSSDDIISYPDNGGFMGNFDILFLARAHEQAVVNFYITAENADPNTPPTLHAQLWNETVSSVLFKTVETAFHGTGKETFIYNNTTNSNEYFAIYVSGAPFGWQALELSLPLPSVAGSGLVLLGCFGLIGRFRRRWAGAGVGGEVGV